MPPTTRALSHVHLARRAAVGLGVALLALAVAVPVTTFAGAKTKLASKSSDGTQGNDDGDNASISDDGRYIAFESDATNLVNNDTNGRTDVFWRGPL